MWNETRIKFVFLWLQQTLLSLIYLEFMYVVFFHNFEVPIRWEVSEIVPDVFLESDV